MTAGSGVQVDGNGSTTGPYVISAKPPVTGCGLSGDGTDASPLAVAVGAWPYACDPDTSGGVIVCGDDGILRGEPRGQSSMTSYSETRDYPDIIVPAAADQLADRFSRTITNPDPCRPALVVVEREVDVYFDLPPGGGAASGYLGDEMYYYRNRGTTTDADVHTQSTKVLPNPGLLAPGASTTLTVDVGVGRGTNGATFHRILVFIRALLISL
ncbi:hypothetical protein [Streptomyces sp. NPDC096013]|uniref:hypothetical protein n=1 Tax=Streptomyces sp. NPDC096013 TaxID=3366069 RepID=UPI0037FF5D6A